MSENSMPCWGTRREVDPTHNPQSAYWAPEPCAHPACLADQCDFHDWDCVSITCLYGRMDSVCDLERGHDGPHVFTPSDEITLVFTDAPVAVQP